MALHKKSFERPPALAAMPLALVPLREGDIKSIRIRQRILPLTEGESRRRRQGVGHADFLCKAPSTLDLACRLAMAALLVTCNRETGTTASFCRGGLRPPLQKTAPEHLPFTVSPWFKERTGLKSPARSEEETLERTAIAMFVCRSHFPWGCAAGACRGWTGMDVFRAFSRELQLFRTRDEGGSLSWLQL